MKAKARAGATAGKPFTKGDRVCLSDERAARWYPVGAEVSGDGRYYGEVGATPRDPERAVAVRWTGRVSCDNVPGAGLQNVTAGEISACKGCGLLPVELTSFGRTKFACALYTAHSDGATKDCVGALDHPSSTDRGEAISIWNRANRRGGDGEGEGGEGALVSLRREGD